MNDVLTVPEWHEEVNLNSKMTLVVVDMQKLFLTDKKSPDRDQDNFVIIYDLNNQLLKKFESNLVHNFTLI